MRYLSLALVLSLALLLAANNAKAAVIYAQLPGPNSNAQLISSTLDAYGGTPGFRTADNFVLATSAIITGVHWWGGVPNSGGENFTFTFYQNSGGPGAVLSSSGGALSETTVNVGSGFDPVIFYSSDLITPFSATAGTTYWLSIFNQASDASWLWLIANSHGDGAVQTVNPGPPWPSYPNYPNNMAFELTSVPEPSSLALLGLGVTGLIGYARRRKQQKASTSDPLRSCIGSKRETRS